MGQLLDLVSWRLSSFRVWRRLGLGSLGRSTSRLVLVECDDVAGFARIYQSKTRVLARLMRQIYHKNIGFRRQFGGTLMFFADLGPGSWARSPRNHQKTCVFCVVTAPKRTFRQGFVPKRAVWHGHHAETRVSARFWQEI